MHRVFIGLGSNLAEPMQQVLKAIERLAQLPDTQLVKHSSMYQSTAVGPGEQPDYINAVAELNTALTPITLLDYLQQIENEQGRERGDIRWTARTLDLDLLLYDRQHIGTARLHIPHPLLAERNFVLFPLHEIAPELTLPNGDRVAALLERVSPEGIQRLEV